MDQPAMGVSVAALRSRHCLRESAAPSSGARQSACQSLLDATYLRETSGESLPLFPCLLSLLLDFGKSFEDTIVMMAFWWRTCYSSVIFLEGNRLCSQFQRFQRPFLSLHRSFRMPLIIRLKKSILPSICQA